jgi:hypothetical protein
MKNEPVTNRGKLAELASVYSLSIPELLAQATFDSLVPGICMNAGCDFTADYEPDQSEGYCEECKTGSVTSALILGGIL